MKKVLLLAIAVFTFGFAQAQKKDVNVRFGIKGGLNIATLAGDVDNASPKIGVHVGGLAEIKLTKKFSIQPEILLSLQGTKDQYSESSPGYSYNSENKVNLTYLNFPVMAKFYVIPNLSLEAGPQLGILVGAKREYTQTENDGGDVTVVSRTADVKGGLKTAEAGFNLGASYYFNDNIFLQARFCIGLSSIDNNGGYYRVDNGNGNVYKYNGSNVTNNVFQLSFGYRF